MNPDISFIITVFNKEKTISAMIHSALRQSHKFNCEYIFVDDASSDDSIRIIEEAFKGADNFTIISNKQNLGPSIRLNQGCALASGKYLLLMDGDDILAKNALEVMLNSIKSENADFVFGGTKVMNQEQESLLYIELESTNEFQISTNPLDTVLDGRYVRMSYLTTKKLYLESGGANDRIFIQDESLPLRLGYAAKKMITLNHPVVYSARDEESLSKNKMQQYHDRFYAYYFALLEFKNLTQRQKAIIYKRAISSVWKAKKAGSSFSDRMFFITYLKTKLFSATASIQNLDRYKNFMSTLKNVRKIY